MLPRCVLGLLYQVSPPCTAAMVVWVLHLCVLVLSLVLEEVQCGLLMFRTVPVCVLAPSARRTPCVHGVMPVGVLYLLLGLQGSMLLSGQRMWCMFMQRMCFATCPQHLLGGIQCAACPLCVEQQRQKL